MNGKVLDKVLIEKGLGIMISSDMKSSQQCIAACNCYCHRRRIGVLCLNIVTMAPGRAVATAGINSKVDVCEKAKHHTELFW